MNRGCIHFEMKRHLSYAFSVGIVATTVPLKKSVDFSCRVVFKPYNSKYSFVVVTM